EYVSHGALAESAQCRKLHAVSGKHAGEGMEEDAGHPQRICDKAGVLACRPAEAVEGIAPRVVAARDRDAPDGVGHVLDGDADEAVCYVLWRTADFVAERCKRFPHALVVERLVGIGAEDSWKECRRQLAD